MALAYLAELAKTTIRNTTNMGYLDLVVTSKAVKASIVRNLGYLDLAGMATNFQAETMTIPNGVRKHVNLSFLKSYGIKNGFELFPNFPIEIREKVYQNALEGRNIVLIVVDQGRGEFCGVAYPLEGVMATNPGVYNYLRQKFNYKSILKNGHTFHSGEVDGPVNLVIIADTRLPSLKIASKLSPDFDIYHVDTLSFEIRHLDNEIASRWIYKNLTDFRHVAKIVINVFVEISSPEQKAVKFSVVSAFDPKNARELEYSHVLHRADGQQIEGYGAVAEIGRLVVDPAEYQGILDIMMMLGRCLKDTDTFFQFPEMITMNFVWYSTQHE